MSSPVSGAGSGDQAKDPIPEEVARLRTIGLSSWAPGTRDHFIRITPVILTGRPLHADRTRAGSGV